MALLLPVLLVSSALAQSPPQPAATQRGEPRGTSGTLPVDVLSAQVMLDRAGFSPGEIDGVAGANLERALRAYQRARSLPTSGRIDPATADLLLQESAATPSLIEYALTPADLEGPYANVIPSDLMAQAELKALVYTGSLEAIAERFHASPRLLRTLNPEATFARAGERIRVPNVTPFAVPEPETATPAGRAAGGRGTRGGAAAAGAPPTVKIVVSKSESALTVEDESGAVLFHAPVTSGSEHDPLPIGMWKVTAVQRLPKFHYNPELFWDADPSHSKATIAPGPNNPVGIAWIDLSKEHYGIHGTPEPRTVGHVQSHGCVRVTNWDAARLLAWVRPGMQVEFRE